MYSYLTEQWYQQWSGKLFGVLGKKISPGHILKSLSRRVALTLIPWGTPLMNSVQHWSSDAIGWKCESFFFRLILGYLFISRDKTQPIERPVYQCMRQRQGFQGTKLCFLAGTAATNVRQHWYCEASAYVEETFDFSRVSQCSWRIVVSHIICFDFV